MPKPDENQPSTEPEETGGGTPAPNDEGGRQTPPDEDKGLKDKHGEDAINRGRYDRGMKAKDDRIAELEKRLEVSGKKAKSGEDALRQIEALKAELADEKVTHALEAAGCVNAKAAKALLDDYKGDVAKLKEACPYLFKKQNGSTGAKPGGAPSTPEERRKRAAEAAAGKLPTRR
jgi:hypothetical protein